MSRHAEYYQKNKEKIQARHREYYLKNRDEIIKRTTQYHRDHPEQAALTWKKSRLSRRYGMSLGEWDILYNIQDRSCAICLKEFKDHGSAHVDHNHNTNQVRGLLCRKCNLMLGHAEDDVSILEKAIEYLERTN